MPVFVWNILSRRLASSPSRIFEVSLEFTKRGVWNTAAIFQYVPGKTIITRCSDLILHKIWVQYHRIWILRERLALFNVISERYRTRLIHTIFDIFWEWCKNIVYPKYISFKTLPGITIWQSHGEIQVWSAISVTVISVTFPSIYVIYMGKNYFR